MKKLIATTALVALMTAGVSGLAVAQTSVATPVPAPVVAPAAPAVAPNGVNQIDSRLQRQEDRINEGVKKGEITPEQAARDQKTDAHVADQLSKDEAKNGGVITKGESTKMNKKLNKNSKRIHHQRAKAKEATAPVTAPVTEPTP